MVRMYRFAGVEIAVSMAEELFYEDEYRLAPFAVDSVTEPYVYEFMVVNQLDEPAGVCIAKQPGMRIYQDGQCRMRYVGSVEQTLEGAYIRAKCCGRERQVQLAAERFPQKVGTKTVLNSIEAEHLIVQAGGVILHCSYIDWNGRGILFTAPSETGKSTQAELWKVYRNAEIINGDRAVMRVVGNQIMAEGIPFSGSSKYCLNQSVPLEAIVYLEQAPKTQIRRLKGYEAFSKVWEGITVNTWDRQDVELASEIVQQIVSQVPVFRMQCTPDESAVLALEQALCDAVEREDSNG